MGLQYGVPLNDLVDQFTFTRFEPHGRVDGHDNIRLCTSVVDYVFRVLGLEYLDRTDLAKENRPPGAQASEPRRDNCCNPERRTFCSAWTRPILQWRRNSVSTSSSGGCVPLVRRRAVRPWPINRIWWRI
jgi:ribonucleoside-diphosphate reductase alpha chain